MKLILILLFSSSFCIAQENTGNKDLYRNKGYFNITRFSYQSVNKVEQDLFIPGEGNFSNQLPSNNANAFSFQTINGYFFSPYFSAGLGVGLDGYNDPNLNTLPVFLDVRAYLNDDFNSPFLFLDFGGLAKVSDNFNKGSYFNIGAGYKVFVSKKNRVALIPEIGWSAKNISLTDEGVRTSDNKLSVSGFQVGLGIIF
jgi:hypothetical protein